MRRDEPNDTPPSEPGDCWASHWYKKDDETGPLAGYGICCPKCRKVHYWSQASNCPQDVPWSVTRSDGVVDTGMKCRHSGVGSCWNWSGSPQDGTLTATPSLHCTEELGGCGWHGFLTNGELKHC